MYSLSQQNSTNDVTLCFSHLLNCQNIEKTKQELILLLLIYDAFTQMVKTSFLVQEINRNILWESTKIIF